MCFSSVINSSRKTAYERLFVNAVLDEQAVTKSYFLSPLADAGRDEKMKIYEGVASGGFDQFLLKLYLSFS